MADLNTKFRPQPTVSADKKMKTSQQVLRRSRSNELFIAVVAPAGAGAGTAASSAFPCHYCARHIVSAGIDEVQYIEPYPKSRALNLHSDSITTDVRGWTPPSHSSVPVPDAPIPKVLFRPFVGVAPRMYARVFLKDRDYKDKITGNFDIGEPDWGGPSDIFKVRYTELEKDLGTVAR